MDFICKVCRGDRIIWMIFLFLCVISIIEVYSASSILTFRTDYWRPIYRHIMFLLMGWGLVLVTHSIPPRYFSLLGFFLLPTALVLLLATRFLGSSINNSCRWIDIVGISFQPSEIAKLSLIVFTAFLLSKKKSSNERKIFYWILISTCVVCIVIIVDNGSTAIMLAGIIYLMMFIGQISARRMIILSSVFVFLGFVFFYVIRYAPDNYFVRIFPRISIWKTRFIDFKTNVDVSNSDFVITDDNYQVVHANIAISNGKIIGKGLGSSSEKDFLPQAYSDFIYAIIIEETGLLGGLGILFLYIVLFIRIGVIANHSKRLFPKFMIMGIALALVTQALANMAVAVNLIPVTGQTLPLVSRGGTATIINCIYFGIILSVSRYETTQGE